MAQPGFVPALLSPDDIKLLQGMIDRERRVPQSTAPRTPLDMQWLEGMNPTSSPVYVAYSEGDIPGCRGSNEPVSSGWCRILRGTLRSLSHVGGSEVVTLPGTGTDPTLHYRLMEVGESVLVYNTRPTKVKGNDVITIVRDRFGSWVTTSDARKGYTQGTNLTYLPYLGWAKVALEFPAGTGTGTNPDGVDAFIMVFGQFFDADPGTLLGIEWYDDGQFYVAVAKPCPIPGTGTGTGTGTKH